MAGLLGALRDPQFRADIRRGLLDAAAGTTQGLTTDALGAPVDLINMALSPLGLGSQAPVGGSEWLAQKAVAGGLLAPPPQNNLQYNAGRLLGPIAAMGVPDAAETVGRGLLDFASHSGRMNPYAGQLGAVKIGGTNTSEMPNTMSESIPDFPDEFTKSIFEYGRKLRDRLLPEAHEVFGKTTFSGGSEIPLTMEMLDRDDIKMLLGRASRRGIYEDWNKVFSGPRGLHDEAASFFYESGLYGRPPPPYVEGWRYGEIPDMGKSFNYRDQQFEHGVSLMALDGEDPSDAAKVFEMLNKGEKRKYKVGGYFVGRGADGEPLVVRAKKLGEIND